MANLTQIGAPDNAPDKQWGVRSFGNRGLFHDIPNLGGNERNNHFIKRIKVAGGNTLLLGALARIQYSDSPG
jgi:hypothetical protein